MANIDLNDPAKRAEALKYELDVIRLKDEAKRAFRAERSGSTAPPEILTLRERLGRDRVKTVWRIDQLQAVGHRVLLAAAFKAGKTTLAANVARAVLDGDSFLDTFHTTAIDGALALFDFEMSPNQLDDWYRVQKISRDDQLVVIPMRGAASSFNIVEPEARAYWVELLKSKRVKYLILDCLRPVLDALGLNEHTEAGLFLTALDALLREADIPEALVIQHMGHKGERARGDSRLLDWPDVGWSLTRERTNGDDDDPSSPRFFKAFGRDVDVPETQVTFIPETRRLSLVVSEDGQGSSRADVKADAARDAIVQFIERSDTPPSATRIEAAVVPAGHTQRNVRAALRNAVERKLLVTEPGKNGGFVYRVAVSEPEQGLIESVLQASGLEPR